MKSCRNSDWCDREQRKKPLQRCWLLPPRRACAGGTDLMVAMRRRLIETDTLVDLAGIEEMTAVEVNADGLHIAPV